MKQNIFSIILIVAMIVVAYFLGRGCKEEKEPIDYSKELQAIKAERDSLQKLDKFHLSQIDSLSALKQATIKEIRYRDREIDENILKDSSNSIVEYRRSLQDNDWLPDGTLSLSYREIGLGAKLMAKLPKIKLNLSRCEEQRKIDRKIIFNKDKIILGWQDNHRLDSLSVLYYKDRLKEETSFFSDRIIIYAGAGANYSPVGRLDLGFQLGIGVRIITLFK